MLSGIHIKRASLEDLDALVKVGDELFDHKIKVNRAKEFFADPRHHLALAYLGGDVVGMASGFHYVHPDKEPALFVNEVGVVDNYQNKGIGRALVKYLCNYGRELGCKEAWIATEESNMAARKSYKAAGGIEDKEPVDLINFDIS